MVVDRWSNLRSIIEIGNAVPHNLVHENVGFFSEWIFSKRLKTVYTLHKAIGAIQTPPRTLEEVLCLTFELLDDNRADIAKECRSLLCPCTLGPMIPR